MLPLSVIWCVAVCAALAFCSLACGPGDLRPDAVHLSVGTRVVGPVDGRVFGQFLERADEAEPGPEAALDPATAKLRRDVVEALREMRIPVLRYPGGTKVETGYPWTALVDNAPTTPPITLPATHPAPRRQDCRFGFHEFLDLCRELGSEPMIVTKLSGDLYPEQGLSMEATVHLASAEVAYMNARTDADLPPDLLAWAKLRAANGHPEPFGVKLWQIGNEPFCTFVPQARKTGLSDEQIAEKYVQYVRRHIDAMRAVDPTIQILVEVQMEDNRPPVPIIDRVMKELGKDADILSYHTYLPWGITEVIRDGQRIPPADLTFREYYYAMVAIPGFDPGTGLSRYRPRSLEKIRATGKPLAITEWNVNTWWGQGEGIDRAKMPRSLMANGIGAAGYLHGFLRECDVIRMGAQSMLVGAGWRFAAVGVSRTDPAWLQRRPSGQVTGLYSNYHGRELLASEVGNNTFYRQPYKLTWLAPADRVAYVDPLVTRTEKTLFVHVINRDMDSVRKLDVVVPGSLGRAAHVLAHVLTGRLEDDPPPGGPTDPAAVETYSLPDAITERGTVRLDLPPHSVCVFEIELQ